jgi:hypothetical protein
MDYTGFEPNQETTDPMLTKPRMRGIIGGAAILALFGGFWCITAVASWATRPRWAIPSAVATIILLLFFCGVRWSEAARLPTSNEPEAAAKDKRAGQLFGIIFGLEGGLIALCSVMLGRAGLDDWIPVEVALIVGAHFLPLAYVFEMPGYYWTGALSVAGVLACLPIQRVSLRLICVGLVMAAVLWSTTALLVLRTKAKEA